MTDEVTVSIFQMSSALRYGAILAVVLVALTIGVGSVTAADPVDDCRTIDTSGDYELTGDVSGDGDCLSITGDDVTFDGNGYTVEGDNRGIHVSGDHVTIENVDVSDATFGIDVDGDDAVIEDVTLEENTNYGIRFQLADRSEIRDSTIQDNDLAGVLVGTGSDETTVSNTNFEGNGEEGINVSGVNVEETVLEDNDIQGSPTGISLESGDDTVVSGGTITEDGSEGETGVSVDAVTDYTIDSVSIDGFDYGIYLENDEFGHLESVDVVDSDRALRLNSSFETDIDSISVTNTTSTSIQIVDSAFVEMSGGSIDSSGFTGISATGVDWLAVDGMTITDSDRFGFHAYNSNQHLELADVTLEGNDNHGIFSTSLVDSLTLTDVTVRENDNDGLRLRSSGTTIDGGVVAGNGGHGLSLPENAEASVSGLTVENNTAWDLWAEEAADVTVDDLHLANETVDHFAGEDVALRSVTAPAPPADDRIAVAGHVEVTSTDTEPSPVDLELAYMGPDTMDVGSIGLDRHDGEAWSRVSGTLLDTEAGSVGGTLEAPDGEGNVVSASGESGEELVGCGEIDTPGTYALGSDLTSTDDNCLEITADDVTLDGNGWTVEGAESRWALSVSGNDTVVTDVDLQTSGLEVDGAHDGAYESVTVRDTIENTVSVDSGSGNTIDELTVTNAGERAIVLDDVDDTSLSSVTVQKSASEALWIRHSTETEVADVSISNTDDRGVSVRDSSSVSLEDVTLTDIDSTSAMYLRSVEDSTVASVSVHNHLRDQAIYSRDGVDNLFTDIELVEVGEDRGLRLRDETGSTLQRVTVDGTVDEAEGIELDGTSDVHLEDVDVLESDGDGIEVSDASGTTLTDVRVNQSGGLDLDVDDSINTVAERLTVGDAVVSFEVYNLEVEATTVAGPQGLTEVGGALEIGGGDASWSAFTQHYAAEDLNGLDEADLGLWYRNGDWTYLDGSTVDPDEGWVSASLDGEGVYGLFGGENLIFECQTLDEPGTYTVAVDLSSDETCLSVEADGVTVEGAGSTIEGSSPDDWTSGIAVDGYDDVTVQNVTVTGWDGTGSSGVAFEDVTGGTVVDSTASSNYNGILVLEGSTVTVDGVDVGSSAGSPSWDAAAGISVYDSEIDIVASSVSQNPMNVRIDGASAASIVDSEISGNALGTAGMDVRGSTEVLVSNVSLAAHENAEYNPDILIIDSGATLEDVHLSDAPELLVDDADVELDTVTLGNDIVSGEAEGGMFEPGGHPSSVPSGHSHAGTSVHVSSSPTNVTLGLHYTEGQAAMVEDPMGLWLNDGSWSDLTDDHDVEAGVVSAPIPDDGEVAIFGDESDTVIDDCMVVDEPGDWALVDTIEMEDDECIDIEADDVRLFGQDYRIEGDGARDHAIHVTGDDVHIQDLEILDMDSLSSGIHYEGTTDGSISDVRLDDGGVGVELEAADRIDITDLEVSNAANTALLLEEATNSTIEGIVADSSGDDDVIRVENAASNVFYDTVVEDADRVSVSDSADTRFEGLELTDSDGGVRVDDSNDTVVSNVRLVRSGEIRLDTAHGSVVSDVVVEESDDRGIYVYQSAENTFSNVHVEGSDDEGIYVDQSGANTFTNVHVEESDDEGIRVRRSDEITFEDVSVSGVSGWDDAVSISRSADTHLSNVTVADFENSGIYLSDTEYTHLEGASIANGDLGIEIEGGSNSSFETISITDVDDGMDVSDVSNSSFETISITDVDDGMDVRGVSNSTFEHISIVDATRHGIQPIEDVADSRFTDVTIDATRWGIGYVEYAENVTLERLTITAGHERGIYVTDSNTELVNSTIEEGSDIGLQLADGPDTAVDQLTVGNSTVSFESNDLTLTATDHAQTPVPDDLEQFGSLLAIETDDLELRVHSDEYDVDTSSLSVWDADTGSTLETSVDTDEEIATASISTDGTYGLLGEEEAPPPAIGVPAPSDDPAEFVISDASVDTTDPAPGDDVGVTATVANVGDESGTTTVALEADGAVVDETSVSLQGGQTERITLSVTAPDEGSLELALNGEELETVTVETPPPEDPSDDDDADDDVEPTEDEDDSSGVPTLVVVGIGGIVVMGAGAAGWLYTQGRLDEYLERIG